VLAGAEYSPLTLAAERHMADAGGEPETEIIFPQWVITGDKKGAVGVGVGSAKEVITAVQKFSTDARRHLVQVSMKKYLTFPHRADGVYGAVKVMLRPAATGTWVIAGGPVPVVLELAGVENALGKELILEYLGFVKSTGSNWRSIALG
jgi:ribosomal protein S5